MEIASYYCSARKRVFDVLLSSILIVLLIPFTIIFYLIFKFLVGGPVIYKQLRTGKNKIPFILYKIRTMKMGAEKFQEKLKGLNEAPHPMFKLANDPRFHKLGWILSQLGFDEIPQLINILKGEMSFVGPRPLPVNESKQLDKTWDFRYLVLPGIISQWALSPKRHNSLETWKKLEQQGLQNASVGKDLKLIVRSFNKLILKNLFTD